MFLMFGYGPGFAWEYGKWLDGERHRTGYCRKLLGIADCTGRASMRPAVYGGPTSEGRPPDSLVGKLGCDAAGSGWCDPPPNTASSSCCQPPGWRVPS